jgi:DNA-binding PadR family transcriptional regulator
LFVAWRCINKRRIDNQRNPRAADDMNDTDSIDTVTYLPLTPAVFHILLALSEGDKHGYAVIVDVRERTAGEVKLGTGTLYTAIKRLLERGLIEDADTPLDAVEEREERRRYYTLTILGRAVVQAEAERLERLVGIARERSLLPAATRRG